MGLPLEGMLVVSVEQAVAAPLCTCRLADTGARVIEVERPERRPSAPAIFEQVRPPGRVPSLGEHTAAVRAEFAQ
jgi:crotonobetainyl-CoA:carnitine CoA-transferase CaiB-like acyl-CoA transferase